MKAQEFRTKKKGELTKLLQEKREQLRELRFKMVRREVKNTSEIGAAKKDIARILTIKKESYGAEKNA